MYVPHQMLSTVVFIGIRDGGKFVPKATGFLGSYEQGGHLFAHIITAEHVISGLLTRGHKIFVRANVKPGDVRDFETEANSWHFYQAQEGERLSDVAVSPLALDGEDEGTPYNLESIPMRLNGDNSVVTLPNLPSGAIGVGDEILTVGLFRSHFGHQRNIPITRSGRIAAMMDEPVWTRYAGYIDAYLAEMHSIAGLSGSPVFVVIIMGNVRQFRLIGLVHGHFDVQNLNDDVVTEDGDGGVKSINTGIGVIIPVEKILKTIAQDSLTKLRQEVVDSLKAEKGATADLDFHPQLEGSTASEPGNPSHKEDFMSLLGAAARSNKPTS